ncbi:MAG TPA: glutathione S-transferase N-terminal domain-containing protein [Kofleriaceae bacterium]|jgi:glutathione S-transferase|nr:glutathione S-transferase N-terminal domain-containing protein [Kofleriaceae bacterium]
MKLHGHPLSPCTRKVLATAAETAAPIELVTVDLLTGDHKQAAHLARHPFGVIPVLDHDGFVLYESQAIMRYLAAGPGGAPLVPVAAQDRARMDQWLSVAQSYIAPHARTLAVQRMVHRPRGLALDLPAIAEAERALRLAYAILDRALAGARYLAGEAFSLADLGVMPYLASPAVAESVDLLADLRHLERWWQEVSARPSWRRATAQCDR